LGKCGRHAQPQNPYKCFFINRLLQFNRVVVELSLIGRGVAVAAL
jgi:hypothetical protein